MQAETNCTSPAFSSSSPATPAAGAPRRLPNAFSDSFLLRARGLASPSEGSGALLAGPWEVETVGAGRGHFHAVVRRCEPVAEGGSAVALLLPLFHALRSLQTQPESLALVLESLGPEGLALIGRVLARRVG